MGVAQAMSEENGQDVMVNFKTLQEQAYARSKAQGVNVNNYPANKGAEPGVWFEGDGVTPIPLIDPATGKERTNADMDAIPGRRLLTTVGERQAAKAENQMNETLSLMEALAFAPDKSIFAKNSDNILGRIGHATKAFWQEWKQDDPEFNLYKSFAEVIAYGLPQAFGNRGQVTEADKEGAAKSLANMYWDTENVARAKFEALKWFFNNQGVHGSQLAALLRNIDREAGRSANTLGPIGTAPVDGPHNLTWE